MTAVVVLGLAVLGQLALTPSEALAAGKTCTLGMSTGIQGNPSQQHTKYVSVSSGTDVTALYNQGRAAIFYFDQWGRTVGFSKDSRMAPWTKNVWGVSTSWASVNTSWRDSWRWKVNFQC